MLNRNGVLITRVPDIYCWKCSDGQHAHMNKKQGRGRAVYKKKEYETDGKVLYSSTCGTCGHITPMRGIGYYEQYAIK